MFPMREGRRASVAFHLPDARNPPWLRRDPCSQRLASSVQPLQSGCTAQKWPRSPLPIRVLDARKADRRRSNPAFVRFRRPEPAPQQPDVASPRAKRGRPCPLRTFQWILSDPLVGLLRLSDKVASRLTPEPAWVQVGSQGKCHVRRDSTAPAALVVPGARLCFRRGLLQRPTDPPPTLTICPLFSEAALGAP